MTASFSNNKSDKGIMASGLFNQNVNDVFSEN